MRGRYFFLLTWVIEEEGISNANNRSHSLEFLVLRKCGQISIKIHQDAVNLNFSIDKQK